MTDDELTDAWDSGQVFPGGITHEQHLRIAWVLHRRHGAEVALARLLTGTERACAVHGCPEKFDPQLTRRWSAAVAAAVEADPNGDCDRFVAAHPDLLQGDRFGRPGADGLK